MDTSAVDTLNQALQTVSGNMPEATQSLSILELATKGGWIMIVLLILSLIAVFVFTQKLIQILAAAKEDKHFMARIRDYVQDGKIDSAMKLCEDTDTPAARMVHKGLTRMGRPMQDVLVIIENVGNIEIGKLEKGLPVLATIAAGAPMIGFLGTVTGMVRAFFDMANAGSAGVDVALLSGGIYEALVTTVGGLVLSLWTFLMKKHTKAIWHSSVKRRLQIAFQWLL